MIALEIFYVYSVNLSCRVFEMLDFYKKVSKSDKNIKNLMYIIDSHYLYIHIGEYVIRREKKYVKKKEKSI